MGAETWDWDAWKVVLQLIGVVVALGTGIGALGLTLYKTRQSGRDQQVAALHKSFEQRIRDQGKKHDIDQNNLSRRQDSLADFIGKQAGRVDVLEERVQNMPRHGDLTRLWKKMDEHNRLISTMSGQLESVTTLLREINAYLINRSDINRSGHER